MQSAPSIKGSSDIIQTTTILYKTKDDFINRSHSTRPEIERRILPLSDLGLLLSKKKSLIYIKAVAEDTRIFVSSLYISPKGSVLLPEGLITSSGRFVLTYDSQGGKFTNHDKKGIWIGSCSENPIKLTLHSEYPFVPYATYDNHLLAILLTEKMKKIIGEYEVANLIFD